MKLSQHIPLVSQLQEADRETLRGDVVAGLTTAVMLVPQAMAYAMLAGLEPIIGLYASTVPLVLYAVFGTSRQLAVGPVAMISLLVASGVAPLANGDAQRYLELSMVLAAMVGVMQLGMGLLRVGFLVKFLSHPVIAGFTSAAAIIIGLSQLKHVLGVNIPRSHHVHEIVLHAIEKLPEVNGMTLGISLVAMALLVVLKKAAPKFPRFLLVVAGGTLAVWGLGLDAQGVAIVGSVPSGLPAPTLPNVGFDLVQQLLPIAITISLVAFMESISVAKAFARADGYEIDADQELKGLGLANLGSAVFSGYPVTGGFSRTAVNAQAGAKTGLAAIITAAVVALTLLFLTPLFQFLPKGVLAAIIMTAVFGLIDVAEARHLWHLSKPDFSMMALTFAATLTLGIEAGILLGVAASLLWFVWQQSKPHVARLGRVEGTDIYRNVLRYAGTQMPEGVMALRIDGPLFFANVAFLKNTIQALETQVDGPLRAVVIDAKAIGAVDASGDAFLQELIEDYQLRDVDVWVSGMRGPVRDIAHRSGLMARLGDGRLVERCHDAVVHYEPNVCLVGG